MRTSTTLTREQAFELVKNHASKKNIVYHMIVVEDVMRELTPYIEEDEEKQGLTGLLHELERANFFDVSLNELKKSASQTCL